MDASIVEWLNGRAQDQPERGLATGAASYLIVAEGVLVFVLLIGVVRRRDAEGLASMVVAGLGTLIALGCNMVATSTWMRVRPYNALSSVHALAAPNIESSFFSDHVIVATGLALAALLVSRPWGLLAVGCCVIVAVGRVTIGAHYPSDTLVAAGVTTVATLLLLPLRPTLARRAARVLRQRRSPLLDGGNFDR